MCQKKINQSPVLGLFFHFPFPLFFLFFFHSLIEGEISLKTEGRFCIYLPKIKQWTRNKAGQAFLHNHMENLREPEIAQSCGS